MRCMQVREVAEWLAQRRAAGAQRLQYDVGTVMRVEPVGMGDRCIQRPLQRDSLVAVMGG